MKKTVKNTIRNVTVSCILGSLVIPVHINAEPSPHDSEEGQTDDKAEIESKAAQFQKLGEMLRLQYALEEETCALVAEVDEDSSSFAMMKAPGGKGKLCRKVANDAYNAWCYLYRLAGGKCNMLTRIM